ncbi:hypothetical protein VSR73_09955 [Paraburkholderia ferrariae]|uniref:Transposase n=1 Tax=Paraburkholderia ferrariae TaxID=386056 RepID=A0ABU9RMS7_9BURK
MKYRIDFYSERVERSIYALQKMLAVRFVALAERMEQHVRTLESRTPKPWVTACSNFGSKGRKVLQGCSTAQLWIVVS